MDITAIALQPEPTAPPFADMVWIPGSTFQMGSDSHYPEERPVHRVSVDGFWIDRAPVTNERFAQFVEDTGHVTFAEIPPRAEDYPGALPDQLFAGSLVFVSPTNQLTSGTFETGGTGPAVPTGGIRAARTARSTVWHIIRSCMSRSATRRRTPGGRARRCRPKRSGSSPRAAGSTARRTPGATSSCRTTVTWPTRGRENSRGRTRRATATKARRRSARFPRTAMGCTT